MKFEQFPVNQGEIENPQPHEDAKAADYGEGVFDPAQSLKEIKNLSKNERSGKIAEFKEKYTRQREGLSKMQAVLTEEVYKNPDITASSLSETIEQFRSRYGFSEEQMQATHAVLANYEAKHRALRDFRSKYPNDDELYEGLFGKRPNGKIEIIEGPVSLYFKCYDRGDYIRTRAIISGEKKTSLLQRLKIIMGVEHGGAGRESPIHELKGTLLVENAVGHTDRDSEITRKHEEQHAINHLWERKGAADAYLRELADGTREDKLGTILHYYREEIEEYLKDEIVAFLRSGGESPHEVKLLMRSVYITVALNPLRKSFDDDIARLENVFVQQGMDKTIIREKMDEYRQYFAQALDQLTGEEYKKKLFDKLCDSIDTYKSITSSKGEEEGFALAINTPLKNWGSVSKRVGIKKYSSF